MSTRPIFSTHPQTYLAAQREEPGFFSSTRKVISLVGTIFFALGAIVMDPVLLIPAGICAMLTFDINCMDLFSTICSALTSSRPATRSLPREAIVIHPSYVSTGGSRVLLETGTVHTARGGGYVAVQSAQQGHQTQFGLGDVGLQRNPTPQVSPQQQGFTPDPQPRRTVANSSSLAGPRVTRGGAATSPPVRRDEDGVALQPRLHTRRGGGLTTGNGHS